MPLPLCVAEADQNYFSDNLLWMVIELHIQDHPAFESLGQKGCISSYWEHPWGLGFGGLAASGYVFSSVTVCCQWLTIHGICNKSSLLTTDAASNSLIHHNGEWLSGAARILFCVVDVLQVHIVIITSVTDLLGHLVSSVWFVSLPLSTFEHKYFLLVTRFLLSWLYLWFSMQWKFICFPKKDLEVGRGIVSMSHAWDYIMHSSKLKWMNLHIWFSQ